MTSVSAREPGNGGDPDAGGSLLLVNGRLITSDRQRPRASAVAIQHGRIVAVGSDADVRASVPPNIEMIDLQGRTATPGLNDAHAHPMGVGLALSDLNLSAPTDGTGTITDLTSVVTSAARDRPSGGWIVGRGYDQARLAERRHPTRHDLDPVSAQHPVLLLRACHHIGVANSLALARAGITAGTPDPDGGTIDRDDDGEPTGVVREAALALVQRAIGAPSEDDLIAALERSGQAFLANGITSVAEAGIHRPAELAAYQRLRQTGRLAVRTYLMMLIDPMLEPLTAVGVRTGFGDDRLRIGPVKLYADGSIGGRTARVRRPYEGEPDNVGLWMEPPEQMTAKIVMAHRAGFQVAIHAIGDAAIDLVLDAYETAQREAPRPDPRHRIEHCSIADEAIMERIAALGVVPIPGTSFLHAFLDAYIEHLGMDRIRYAYGLASFARRGIVAAASSDAPIVPIDPLTGLQTMLTRRDARDRVVWAEEAVNLDEAIRAYTANGAYASFEERSKGRLVRGLLGDVTVFNTDLDAITPSALSQACVDLTIVNGRVVYARC